MTLVLRELAARSPRLTFAAFPLFLPWQSSTSMQQERQRPYNLWGKCLHKVSWTECATCVEAYKDALKQRCDLCYNPVIAISMVWDGMDFLERVRVPVRLPPLPRSQT